MGLSNTVGSNDKKKLSSIEKRKNKKKFQIVPGHQKYASTACPQKLNVSEHLDFASLKPAKTLTWPAHHVTWMDHGWNSPEKKQPETDFLRHTWARLGQVSRQLDWGR